MTDKEVSIYERETVSYTDRLRAEKIGLTCDPEEFESIFGVKLKDFLSRKEYEITNRV